MFLNRAKYSLEKEDREKPEDLFLDGLHPTEKYIMKNADLFIQNSSIYLKQNF